MGQAPAAGFGVSGAAGVRACGRSDRHSACRKLGCVFLAQIFYPTPLNRWKSFDPLSGPVASARPTPSLSARLVRLRRVELADQCAPPEQRPHPPRAALSFLQARSTEVFRRED